jgi:peptidoglycan hydrolase CwlO-like protein
MSSQIDDLTAEVSKEKKLKSRSEHYSKQLEDEIEILKVNITGACYTINHVRDVRKSGFSQTVSTRSMTSFQMTFFRLNNGPLGN